MLLQRLTLDLPTSDECQQKYGSALVWKACCSVFDYMNLAAVRPRTPVRLRGVS